MSTRLWLGLFGAVWFLAAQNAREAPSYSASSIVNAASQQPDAFAPNTIITIYGRNLAYVSRGLGPGDINGLELPTVLANTGVRVTVRNLPCAVYYVSPTQINALLPANLLPGSAALQVTLDSLAGPRVTIEIRDAGPGLFLFGSGWAVATRVDGTPLTPDNPARAGEWVILYATGLGSTDPPARGVELARRAANVVPAAGFRVFLDNGVAETVAYAGLTPGFAGLYQVNLRVPDTVGTDPAIQVESFGRRSGEGVRLPVRPP
jgi:uncharacterized protein (TIGR03437 family)